MSAESCPLFVVFVGSWVVPRYWLLVLKEQPAKTVTIHYLS